MTINSAWQDVIRERFQEVPTPEEKAEYFGTRLIKKWKIEFEKKCWDSEQFAEVSFHVLFGQLSSVRNKRILYGRNFSDPRVHLMLFQRSGTGKGRGFDFTVDMCEEINQTTISPDDMKDATLLGSMIREGNNDPVRVRGILDERRIPQVNILIQNEATLIIDARKSDLSKNFMNYYQKAMNPIGTPDNRIEKEILIMQSIPIRINPVCSFYLTTYPPDRLLETITKAGFIQRMITLNNIISFESRIGSWEKMTDNTGDLSEEGDYRQDVIKALEHIDNYYKDRKVILASNTKETCKEAMREIYKPLSNVNEVMREHLGDFVPRTYDNVMKLSYHHAMCRLSDYVEIEDIAYGLNIIEPIWSRMIMYMEESDEIITGDLKKRTKHRKDAFRIYDMILKAQAEKNLDRGGWVKKEAMVKLLSYKMHGWDKSKQTVRNRLNMLIKSGYFEQKEEKGVLFLKKKVF